MKKVLQKNGYTVYQYTAHDVKDGKNVGEYSIYYSCDVREFGREYSDAEYEGIDSFDTVLELINSEDAVIHAAAIERAGNESTAVTYDLIEEKEAQIRAEISAGAASVENYDALTEEPEAPEEPEEKKAVKRGYDVSQLYKALKCVDADIFHAPRGNSKLKKIAAWNILPVVTCGGNECPGCYAVKNCLCHGGDVNKNNCLRAWAENTALLFECEKKKDYSEFVHRMCLYLANYDGEFFRFHAAGDFYSVLYMEACATIAKLFRGISFLAFTKRFNVLKKHDAEYLPMWEIKNFCVLLSMWPGVEIPEGLEHYRRAWVQNGKEARIPENAFHCPGHCDACNEGIPACWLLNVLNRDVWFDFH